MSVSSAPPPHISHQTAYRADIDGLRAVAVLAVVGFHAFPKFIPGGFLGVDVFFVISGFLITSIIHREIIEKRFTLSGFYLRRLRRIVPALALTLAATLLAGWLFLFPNEFRQLGVHIAAASILVSNLVLWNEAGYFDTASESKPLLHLWSLGIEEQFYLLWPAIVFLVVRVRVRLSPVIVALLLMSFGLCIVLMNRDLKDAAFYLPTSRGWELMLGCGLANWNANRPAEKAKSAALENYASMLGLTMILFAMMVLEGTMRLPGWFSLFPTVGTVLVLISGSSWLNRRLLSLRPLVYVGLISYPLYLWHWPLFSFAHILNVDDPESKGVVIVVSILLAALTYECIEKSVRTRWKGNTRIIHALLISLVMFLVVGAGISSQSVFPRNASNEKIFAAQSDWEYPVGLDEYRVGSLPCGIKRGGSEQVLFIGDSLIEQYAPRIRHLIDRYPERAKTAVFVTRPGRLPVPNVYVEGELQSERDEYMRSITTYCETNDVDALVVGAAWLWFIPEQKYSDEKRLYWADGDQKKYFDKGGLEPATRELEAFLTKHARNMTVYLVLNTPFGEAYSPHTASGSRIFGTVGKSHEFAAYSPQESELRQRMTALGKRAGAIIIDPFTHFCQNNRCRVTERDGTFLFKDASHLRASYVRDHVEYLDETILKTP